MPEYDLYDIRGIIRDFAGDIDRLKKSVEKVIEISKFVTEKIKSIRKQLAQLERDLGKAGDKTTTVRRKGSYSTIIEPEHPLEGEGERDQNIDIYEKATAILYRNIEAAAKINTEYNHPFFLKRLRIVADNPDLIHITKTPYTSYPVVKIRMNEVAGSLEDYANGVKKARERFGVREFHGKTNWFWEEKYYGQAREARALPQIREKPSKNLQDKRQELINKYWETLQFRMDSVGKIAPFWELLDQGSMPMSSDRGGRPYPEGVRTGFIQDSIREIELWVAGRRDYRDYDYEDEVLNSDIIKENIRNTEVMLSRYEKELENINNLLDEAELMEIDTEIYEDITRRIDKRIDDVDKTKLNTLDIGLKTGNFGNLRVTARNTIELTKPKVPGGPTPKRVRIGITRAYRILGGKDY